MRFSPFAEQAPANPASGTGWRWMATVLLILITLPVFAAAAVAALPVLLAAGLFEAARHFWHTSQDQTRHTPASIRSR